MKLYELTQQLIEVGELASDPEIPAEALADTLEALEGEFNEKAIAISHVLKNTDGDVGAIDEEIKRLQLRKKFMTSGKERLKAYLRDNMQRLGIKKITSPLFTISLRAPAKSVHIIDEAMLTDEYFRTTYTVNKAAITAALKAGGIVAGAELIDGKAGVMIK
jgi:hypothetical protein